LHLILQSIILHHQYLLFLIGSSSLGWVYPEHRTITMIAIHDLEPKTREILDDLWTSARVGYESRLRMPFWLIPGDLLIAGPILALTSPTTLADMAVKAGNGGVIPWQLGMATSFGRFYFMFGREIGAYFYGYTEEADCVLAIYDKDGGEELILLDLRSTYFDFPILEYRPFRTFSMDQGSSLVFQLTGGDEIPTRVTVVIPEDAPDPDTKTIWHFSFRVAFDWRSYFSFSLMSPHKPRSGQQEKMKGRSVQQL